MIIECLETGVFAENCYVVGCAETNEGVVIDPGDDIPRIVSKVREKRLDIKYILLTHGHLDHVKELVAFKTNYDVPVLMHADDQFLLDNLPAQAAAFGMSVSGVPRVDMYIKDGQSIAFGTHKFQVIHTPGHSPGSVTFSAEGAAFSGDVLFSGSIGRTDLPGGNYHTLMHSIKNRLLPLGEHVTIFPGHGPATTIAQELKYNPFLIETE